MIDKKDASSWFSEGRGNVSTKVAKTDAQVLSQESEESLMSAIPSQDGAGVNESGKNKEYATGAKPFHEGRGNGRGNAGSSL